MINIRQKVLTVIMTSVLTLGAASIVNADTFETRLSGKGNGNTAILVSQAGWTQSDTVVIASSVNFPDVLCAVPLAKKYNAPILLTDSDDLSNETRDEIVRLNAKRAIIIGGTASVAAQVELELKAMKVTDIQRYGGADRYGTSMLVAKQLDKPTAVVVAYGKNFPDALSISAIAAQQGMPIILSDKNGLSSEAASYISSNGIKKTYIVGGTGVLNSSLESQVPNPTRLAGQDRYETNLAILKNFTSSLNFRKLYIATGNDFAGALIASPLAAKTQSPVILVDSDLTDSMKKYVVENKASSTNVIAIGDLRTVSRRVLDEVRGIAVDKQSLTADSMADEIISEVIKPGMTDFEKELALHDYIVKNTTYDWNYSTGLHSADDSGINYTADGVLLKGTGAARSYAEAMKLLLNKVGIESQIVSGTAHGNVQENWTWNIVKIGGSYYQLDVAWDGSPDSPNSVIGADHTYFNVTDDKLAVDHKWNVKEFPVCNDVKYSYKNCMQYEDNKTSSDTDSSGSKVDANEDNSVNSSTTLPNNTENGQSSKDVITFPDSDINNKIRALINKPTGDIYKGDVSNITYLGLTGSNVKNLEGIQYLTNLTKLELGSNIQISDISPLKGLTNLTSLDLSDNQISDISALKGLTKLTTLNLNSNKISDISPLKDLTNLKNLNLGINEINNIYVLNGLTNLTYLYLPINKINNISALKGLTNLTFLNLNENQISDISTLKNLTNLLELQLCGNNPEVSSSDIQALQMSLPKCKINY